MPTGANARRAQRPKRRSFIHSYTSYTGAFVVSSSSPLQRLKQASSQASCPTLHASYNTAAASCPFASSLSLWALLSMPAPPRPRAPLLVTPPASSPPPPPPPNHHHSPPPPSCTAAPSSPSPASPSPPPFPLRQPPLPPPLPPSCPPLLVEVVAGPPRALDQRCEACSLASSGSISWWRA